MTSIKELEVGQVLINRTNSFSLILKLFTIATDDSDVVYSLELLQNGSLVTVRNNNNILESYHILK